MQNKQMRQIKSAYQKRLNNLNKSLFNASKTSIIAFVEYLKYIRDLAIVRADGDITSNNTLATLMVAINEFDAYMTCEESKQKDFHWKTFCEFLKLNMEEWLVLNDTI